MMRAPVSAPFILLLPAAVFVLVLSACRPESAVEQAAAATSPAATMATPRPVATNTPLPTTTHTPASTPEASTPEASLQAGPPDLPEEYYIRDIRGHKQYFAIGCEASTAVDWASYYGKTINEFELQYRLPLSDNPDLGFVGSVDSAWGQVPPYAYGVHAGPIAEVLSAYGLPSVGIKGATLEEVKAQVATDNPVIAWVIGNVVGGVPYEYADSKGNKTIVAAYEHVVIVTGYRADAIRYMNNGKFYESPVDNFLNSWGVLGNMAVFRQE